MGNSLAARRGLPFKGYARAGVCLVLVVLALQAVRADADSWVCTDLRAVQNGASSVRASSGHIGIDVWDLGGPLSIGPYWSKNTYCDGVTDFPFGVFAPSYVVQMSLEIYPYTDPRPNHWSCSEAAGWGWSGYDLQPAPGHVGPVYGGLRVVASQFNPYSPPMGIVSVPQTDDPDTGMVNGFVCHSGANRPPSCDGLQGAPDHSVKISWFGQRTVTNRSSTGYPVASFNSWDNQSAPTGQPSTGSGYYTSGPLILGRVAVFINNQRCDLDVTSTGERIDFNLDDRWLGHSELCTPLPNT